MEGKVSRRSYDKMLKKTKEGSDGKNVYTCQNKDCAKNTLFIHWDVGVTPMFMICEGCGSRSISNMYISFEGNIDFKRIWYRPTFKEAKKINKKYPGMMDHFMRGGLHDKSFE